MIKILSGYFNLELALFSVSLIYVYSSLCFVLLSKKQKIKLNKKFYKTLSNGLKDGNITTADDIKNIFNGIFNSTCDIDDAVNCNRIINLLRKYLVLYINNEDEANNQNKTSDKNINIKNLLTDFIEHYEKRYPYSNLPLAEMNILNDINVFIDNNDVESVKRKVNELAGIMQVRNDDIQGLKSANKWSVPLSIIGLILTIIFGILSYIK